MIGIQFNKKDYEYDIYSLVQAFYPGEELRICYEEEQQECGYDKMIRIVYGDKDVNITILESGQCFLQEVIALDYADRKTAKSDLKRMVYRVLSNYTKKTLPWGNLTGIRPVKLVMSLIENGMPDTKAVGYMQEVYDCSKEKADLSIAIANREREILKDIDYRRGYSLYVGIPFCPSICLYCSFSSSPYEKWKNVVDPYLDACCRELDFISQAMDGYTLDTVYIGGGTPTTLDSKQMVRLLSHIQKRFAMDQIKEFTIEAGRPDSITEKKLQVIKGFPVTRISVNPQTMNQKTLDVIGRKHTVEDTMDAFYMAREAGFDNINMDIIVGLPGESKEDVSYTLEKIKGLNPDSLTAHSLAVKRASRLKLLQEEYKEIAFENSQETMDMVMKCAMECDMSPYYLYRQKNMAGNLENIGYAKLDKAGRYNILIMEEKQPILAAGAGGATKLVNRSEQRIMRIENVKDITNYITRIDEMIERKRIGIETWRQEGRPNGKCTNNE